MSQLTLDLVVGTARDWPLQAQPAAGAAWSDSNPSPFLSSDTLSTEVWAGKDQPALLTPATIWLDAAAATFQVTFNNADTATLAPGTYSILTTATRAGRSGTLLRAFLRLTAAPGTGATPLAFTTLPDLLQYAGWLQDLQADADSAESGFQDEQVRATTLLIDMLAQSWKPAQLWPGTGAGSMSFQFSTGLLTQSAGWWLRQQIVPLVPLSTAPANFKDRLSMGANLFDARYSSALLVHDAGREILAKWAISYICKQQVGTSPGGESYRVLAKRFGAEASSLYRCRRFEIDLSVPQTGYASILIDGGSTSLR